MYLRLYEAFMYLKRELGINQTILAQKIGVSQTTVSRQLNTADLGTISTEFLFRMNSTFDGIFNLDYIVNGTGSLLVADGEASSPAPASEPAPAPSTTSDRMVELCASLAQDLESVRRTMADTLSQLRAELHEARRMNAQMRATLLSLGHNAPYPEDDTAPTAIAAEGTITNEGNSLTDKPIKTKKNETENASNSTLVSPPN